jgi:predicted dehydrogenase
LFHVVPASAYGANSRLQIAFIGAGGRARWLLKNEEFPGAEIVALADCFLPRCEEAAKSRRGGKRWRKYQDYRRLLEKEKLDAVFVETTTHARALIAIHAMQAGLDVYAEKPMTLTIAEGRVLADAVKRYGRVLQCGTQQRSIPINAWASKIIREGALGKVHTVIACNFEPPRRWEPKPEQAMPQGLDWDQWCNQTELRPYHSELQRRWAWYRDYDGGGQSWGVTGWGTHALDQVQCALGTDDTGPVEIWPEESGPQCRVTMRYAGGTLLKLEGRKRDHADLGAIFIGDKGAIEIKRGTVDIVPRDLVKGSPDITLEGPGENRWHIENFLDCVRTRKQPNAHVEAAHRATTVCYLVNICRDLGRKLRWDPVKERFLGDEEGDAMLSRPRRKGFEMPSPA